MNPFFSNKGTSLGLLIAVGFTSGLVASQLHESSQPNNGLQAAQLQAIAEEGCPYPPQTPAATGDHPEFLQPGPNRQPASLARPAVYIEMLVPSGDGDNVSVII